MADLKISQLTAATTPLAGTEVVPLVQSGTTKKVTVSDLTAGRAVSVASLSVSTGNVSFASGQGIDFSATPGTGTSELFNDYEEGTFQAVISFGGGTTGQTYSVRTCSYTKIGDRVSVSGYLEFTNKGSSTGVMKIEGLPFLLNSSASSLMPMAVMVSNITYTGQIVAYGTSNTDKVEFLQLSALGALTALTDANVANNTAVVLGFTYQT